MYDISYPYTFALVIHSAGKHHLQRHQLRFSVCVIPTLSSSLQTKFTQHRYFPEYLAQTALPAPSPMFSNSINNIKI